MLKSPNSFAPYLIIMTETIGIIVLYAVIIIDEDIIAFNLKYVGKTDHLGIISKIVNIFGFE